MSRDDVGPPDRGSGDAAELSTAGRANPLSDEAETEAVTPAVVPVSVVVPVRNEVDSIDALLNALATHVPRPCEIIVVDAGSTDGTRDRLRSWAARLAILTVIEVPRAYPGEGRNIGTKVATSGWIAYIDAGIEPQAGWLQSLWHAVQTGTVDAAYGFHTPALTTYASRWFALATMSKARRQGEGLMRNHCIVSSLVRKDAWARVGGFPPFRAAEDRIFMMAVNHGPFVEVPEAVVTWAGPSSWGQIWRRTAMLAEHGARAGRTRDWHWPTVRIWAVGALMVWLLPSPANVAVLAVALVARAQRRRQRHTDEPGLSVRQTGDLTGVAMCMIVLDLAMYWGWARRYWRYRDPDAERPGTVVSRDLD